jgi:hypothetical protein
MPVDRTLVKDLEKDVVKEVDVSEMKEEDLPSVFEDMGVDLPSRIEALNRYNKNKTNQYRVQEYLNKIKMMYVFSSITSIKNYIDGICLNGTVDPIIKLELCTTVKNYGILNVLCKNIVENTRVSSTIKIKYIDELLGKPEYSDDCFDYMKTIVNDPRINYEFRLNAVVKRKISKPRKKILLFMFFNNPRNSVRYRVIASQFIFANFKDMTQTERVSVQEQLLKFTRDDTIYYNLRADAADVILHFGDIAYRDEAVELLTLLGRDTNSGKTVYDNKQNVHNASIEKSVIGIIEHLCSRKIMTRDNGRDINFEFVKKELMAWIDTNKNKSEEVDVDGKSEVEDEDEAEEIDVDGKSEVEDEVEAEEVDEYEKAEEEEDVDDINVTLNKVNLAVKRIQLDQALYSKYNCNLRHIMVMIWSYINKHEHREEITKCLIEELESAYNTCSSGFASRIVNSISGFGDFSVSISWEDQIVANLAGRLNSRIMTIADEAVRESVINEMMIPVTRYLERKNYMNFFRLEMPKIRQELFEEFKDHIEEKLFDLYFRKAISIYEGVGR